MHISAAKYRAVAIVACVIAASVHDAFAQSREFTLDPSGTWSQTRAPAEGTDEGVIAGARAFLANSQPATARRMLTHWLESEGSAKSPLKPEAHLLRGDARLALGWEEDALRDYEVIATDFTASDVFATALEREFAVAQQYLNGMGRRVLGGFRLDTGVPLAEEIILRINERLPGSRLAERSLLELADYYYRERDLRMAAETYDVFLQDFPKSEYRKKAMQRRAYANIARFKGPRYDPSGLVEAKLQIDDFAREFPLEAEQTGMSDALLARLDESIAGTTLETARYYLKRNDLVSARMTLRRLVRRYPQTAAGARAGEMLDRYGWSEEPPHGEKPAPLKGAGK